MSPRVRTELEPELAPPGDPWIRTAQLVDVSFAERTIELIVIPYETPTLVDYRGPDGAREHRPRRVRRDRTPREPGPRQPRARAYADRRPRDRASTRPATKVWCPRSRSRRRRSATTRSSSPPTDASTRPRRSCRCRAGCNGADRSAYHVSKAWLGHIAMTSEPAYEGAHVLAVRSAATRVRPVRDPEPGSVARPLAEDRLDAHGTIRHSS